MADRGKRFVFDTNVIVSALLTKKSVARDSLDKARGLGEILLSLEVVGELYNVLGRPVFDRYSDEEDRDPKDDKFLELAVNGKADFISGDGDLQVLNPFKKIKIVSPREFLDADIKK